MEMTRLVNPAPIVLAQAYPIHMENNIQNNRGGSEGKAASPPPCCPRLNGLEGSNM